MGLIFVWKTCYYVRNECKQNKQIKMIKQTAKTTSERKTRSNDKK